MNKENYIGIMSGTSLDSIDVVLCEFDEYSCVLLASLAYPFPNNIKSDILFSIKEKNTLEEIGILGYRLGLLFAEATKALLVSENIDTSNIIAIGLHGQTLWHHPSDTLPFSMQLGDPNILTARTGISVVSDFRRKDMALGGQGAPFAPAFHEFIFSNIKKSTAIINIGGMANITVLDKKLIGYDTGCGNVLLDLWIQEHKGEPFDKEGSWAKSGIVDAKLLDIMINDSYFTQAYPKSTGREKFNKMWLKHILEGSSLEPRDIQRTLLELVALSIATEVQKFNRELVLLCGGGAKNSFLYERIQALLPQVEVSIAKDADYIEAMTFAWLAYKRVHKEKVNLKDVTGASANAILGGIYE